MIEMQCPESLFYLPKNEHEAAVVTTNGYVRKNGNAVCGKGQALEAKNLFLDLEEKLGRYLRKYGNRAFYMGQYLLRFHSMSVVTFPTKHHYRDNSDINLIAKSAHQLKQIANKFELSKIYLPPVGCGLGKLSYESQVRPIIQDILNDDRFVVVLGYKNL